jgi:DNA invertase Pin-like site-specific DNA recombinase
VLTVTRRDRLARSTRDLLNTQAQIADKGAGFRSLADAWADTTTSHGRLMLTVLGGLAEFERDLIGARTTEGRERANPDARDLVNELSAIGSNLNQLNLPLDDVDEDTGKKYPPVDMTMLNEREVQQPISAYFGIADKDERRFLRHVMTLMTAARH